MNSGPGLTPPPSGGTASSNAAAGGGRPAQITSLPDALENIARARRLEGEVVQQNRDGSTRIRTAEGNIDLQIRGRQPQPGQRVDVELPAGRPPRQAIVRQAPPQTEAGQQPRQTQAPNTPPPQSQAAQTNTTARPAPAQSSTTAPRPVTTTPQNPAQPQPLPQNSAPPAPLPQNAAVRLVPVQPAQVQQIIQQLSALIETQPVQLQQIQYTANLIAQVAPDALAKALLQLRRADIQQVLQQLQTLPPATQATPIAPASGAPQSPAQQLIQQLLNFTAPQTQTPQASGTQPQTIQTTQLPQILQSQFFLVNSTTTQPQSSPVQLFQTSLQTPSPVTKLDVQILQLQPPGVQIKPPQTAQQNILPLPATLKIPAPVATPQTQAGTLIAQVTGFTPQNLPLITLQWPGTPLPQSFILQFSANNLQVGSQIQILPQQIAGQTQTPAPLPIPTTFTDFIRSFSWPVMDEIYQSLMQTSPQAAQTLSNILPNPSSPAQMGPAALFFIAAVRAGDFSNWMGERNLDILRRIGKTPAINRMGQELGALNRVESTSGEWRSLVFPFFNQSEIQKVALHTKYDDGHSSDDPEKKNGQTRFIFDLSLTRMGTVQLDGLIRDKRMDLILRTQQPLSDPMRQTMRKAYAGAVESADLYGELTFQGDPRTWVNVIQQQETLGVDV